MSVYLHATLEVKPAGFGRFCEAMGRVVSIVEGAGWRLAGGFVQRTGRLNTVIDLWELDDLNHLDVGLAAIREHADGPELGAVLAETVVSETLVFADRAPYMHP